MITTSGEFYASTANRHHLPPSSVAMIEDNWHLGRIGGHSFDRLAGSLINAFTFHVPANPPLFLNPVTGQPIHGSRKLG